MEVDSLTGLVSWLPDSNDVGDTSVVVKAANMAGFDTQSYALSVTPPMSLPVITSIPDTTAVEDSLYSYQVVADGYPSPVFELLVSPAGMEVDSLTGLISWWPDSNDIGDTSVVVEARNVAGFDTQSYTLSVTPQISPPVITSIPDTTAVEDSLYDYQVTANGYPPPTFELLVSPGGMEIDSLTGLISWWPDSNDIGDTSVVVKASNVAGFDSQSYILSVTPPMSLPVITSIPDTTAVEDSLYSYQVTANGYPPPSFELLVSPGGMEIDSVTGLVSWLPDGDDVGDTSVVVMARNDVGFDTQSYTLSVTPKVSPPVITSIPDTTAVEYSSYLYHVTADGYPSPVFELLVSPVGMEVDSVSGLVSWLPDSNDIGDTSVVVKATNMAGFDTQSYTLNVAEKAVPPNQVPGVPSLLSPASGEVLDSLTACLCIGDVADPDDGPDSLSCIFQLSLDSLFTPGSMVSEWEVGESVTETTCTMTPALLEDGVGYYWRASAYDGADSSGWSSWWFFEIDLPKPVLGYIPGSFEKQLERGVEDVGVPIDTLGLESPVDTLVILNSGDAELEVSLSSAEVWLAVGPDTAYTVAPLDSVLVELTYTSLNLSSGTYVDTVTMVTNDPDSGAARLPVELMVRAGLIEVAPESVYAETGLEDPWQGMLMVHNRGDGWLVLRACMDTLASQCLLVSPGSLLVAASDSHYLGLEIDGGVLGRGSHAFCFEIVSNDLENSPCVVPVLADVRAPACELSPSDTLHVVVGDGPVEKADSMCVVNAGNDTLAFGVSESLDWALVEPESLWLAPSDTGRVMVYVDVSGVCCDTVLFGEVVFTTNDPENRSDTLIIEVDVGTAVSNCVTTLGSNYLDRYRMRDGSFEIGMELPDPTAVRDVDVSSVELSYGNKSVRAVESYERVIDGDGDGVEELWVQFRVSELNNLLGGVRSGEKARLALKVVSRSGQLFAGIVELEVRGIGIPVSLRNYPNPFNPVTTIEYVVPLDGRVVLRIYGVGGQLVKTLVDDVRRADVYRFEWDGCNQTGREVSSGIYFGVLNVGSERATAKLLLLK
jgi:hypothetical protein